MLTQSETELTTAATDAVLGGLCLVLAWRLSALPTAAPLKQHVWMAVLVAMAIGALLGAVVHGLALAPGLRQLLWKPLYLSLGLTVALVVVAAVADWSGDAAARRTLPWAIAAGVAFFAWTELRPGSFAVFLAYEGVGLATALGIYLALMRAGTPGAGAIAAGLLLSVVAAVVQTTGWTIRLGIRLDHNGLFHLVQIAGVIVIASGVRARISP